MPHLTPSPTFLRELRRSGVVSFSWKHPHELIELARSLGEVIADPRTGDLVRDLRPEPLEQANPNTLSSRFGLGTFPFHTEAAYLRPSPKLMILACEDPGDGRRATRLLDATPLLLELRSLRRRGVWLVDAGRGPFLTRLTVEEDGDHGICYDPACFRPRGRAAQVEDEVLKKFTTSKVPLEVRWAPGEGVVIDNRRMLHGRGSADVADRKRLLKRILVK